MPQRFGLGLVGCEAVIASGGDEDNVMASMVSISFLVLVLG